MATSRIKRVGLVFVFGGVALYGCWILWVATRTEVPLQMPISMAVGHVRSRDFKVNLSTTYLIEIEVTKNIPFDTLNCLLGMHMGPTSTNIGDCPDRPSVVEATWSLTSRGQVVAHGSSDDYRSGVWANDTISRELGHFEGKSGRRYILDVNVLADGSSLRTGNPKLVVEWDPELNEGIGVWSVILFIGCGLVVVVGVIVLIVAYRRHRLTGRAAVGSR